MNKCPYGLKRFHALKKELRIFLTTIFQVPGMDLPEPRDYMYRGHIIYVKSNSKEVYKKYIDFHQKFAKIEDFKVEYSTCTRKKY